MAGPKKLKLGKNTCKHHSYLPLPRACQYKTLLMPTTHGPLEIKLTIKIRYCSQIDIHIQPLFKVSTIHRAGNDGNYLIGRQHFQCINIINKLGYFSLIYDSYVHPRLIYFIFRKNVSVETFLHI